MIAPSNITCTKRLFWIGLLSGIFLCEYLLFRTYILREVVSNYPAYSDQPAFLRFDYEVYEHILNEGFFQGLAHALMVCNPLFHIQVVIFFVFFGASRASALTLNFCYFLILQVVTFKTAKSLTGNRLLAITLLGLFLTALTPFFSVGGLWDFRTDMMAFCLYGIFIAAVIKSEIFLNKKWAIISAFVAVALILLRTVTIAYVGLIFGFLLCYFLLYRYFVAARDGTKFEQVRMRLKNFLFFGGIVAISCMPFIWFFRANFYGYYMVGHFVNNEKYVRAQMAGVINLASNLLFYPIVVVKSHIGILAGSLCLLLIGISIYGFIKNKFRIKYRISFKEAAVFLIICILAPLLALTFDLSKSGIVAGIMVPPIFWLVFWIFIHALGKQPWLGWRKDVIPALSAIIISLGIINYAYYFVKHDQLYERGLDQITKMYDDIGSYFYTVQKEQINFAADQVNDYLNLNVLTVLFYEKHNILLNSRMTLGTTLFALNLEQALEALQESDVFIANLNDYEREDAYPFNVSIRSIRPQLKEYAERVFISLGDYDFKGSTYRVYIRPIIQIWGGTGDKWITDQGIFLRIPAQITQPISKIILQGTADFTYLLPKKLKVFAFMTTNTGTRVNVPVTFTAIKSNYKIVLALAKQEANILSNIRNIRLKFSDYFIPEQHGISVDQRRLVLRIPTRQEIVFQKANDKPNSH